MRHVPLCFEMDPTWLEAMNLLILSLSPEIKKRALRRVRSLAELHPGPRLKQCGLELTRECPLTQCYELRGVTPPVTSRDLFTWVCRADRTSDCP